MACICFSVTTDKRRRERNKLLSRIPDECGKLASTVRRAWCMHRDELQDADWSHTNARTKQWNNGLLNACEMMVLLGCLHNGSCEIEMRHSCAILIMQIVPSSLAKLQFVCDGHNRETLKTCRCFRGNQSIQHWTENRRIFARWRITFTAAILASSLIKLSTIKLYL